MALGRYRNSAAAAGHYNQPGINQSMNRIPCPLSVCVAMSQGYIGYDLQNALREELLDRGIEKGVATVLTQVVVDSEDPAFLHLPAGPGHRKQNLYQLQPQRLLNDGPGSLQEFRRRRRLLQPLA